MEAKQELSISRELEELYGMLSGTVDIHALIVRCRRIYRLSELHKENGIEEDVKLAEFTVNVDSLLKTLQTDLKSFNLGANLIMDPETTLNSTHTGKLTAKQVMRLHEAINPSRTSQQLIAMSLNYGALRKLKSHPTAVILLINLFEDLRESTMSSSIASCILNTEETLRILEADGDEEILIAFQPAIDILKVNGWGSTIPYYASKWNGFTEEPHSKKIEADLNELITVLNNM